MMTDDSKVQSPKSSTLDDAAAKNDKSNTSSNSTNNAVESSINKKSGTVMTQNQSSVVKTKLSKTAVLSLLLALTALAGVGALYWFFAQHSQATLASMAAKNDALIEENNYAAQKQAEEVALQLTEIKGLAEQQVANVSEQLNGQLASLVSDELNSIRRQVAELSNTQPHQWLINEVEFIIRLANRTLVLDKNLTTVIMLLTDADNRLANANDPQFMPLREAIHQDIARLQLLPALATDDTILSLMALANQVELLPIAMTEIPEETQTPVDTQLSTDVADWKENLAKTWQRFLGDFIAIKYRKGTAEPLMSPSQQQNLRQNLHLKLQLVQWAASKQSATLYQAALTDANQWLNKYFDHSVAMTQEFSNQLLMLQQATIEADYPNALYSLSVVRQRLTTFNDAKALPNHALDVNNPVNVIEE